MKNKKLLFKISIIVISVLICSIIILALLGLKERKGYLSEFSLNMDNTLQLNGLDINKTKQLFTIDNKLDETSISNFIFTNISITNYSYNFRIKYYDKVFRNSDIYGVYIDTNKILEDNNFIKEINMYEAGSPFGSLISTKIIDFEEIDNINYKLKLKITNIIIFLVIILIIFTIFFKFNLFEKIIFIYRKINKIYIYKIYPIMNMLIHCNNKKYVLLVATIFFLTTFFTEIRLFKNEIYLEFLYNSYRPEVFIMESVYFNTHLMENPELYLKYYRKNISQERRDIKEKYLMYYDQYLDSHITANIYAALKTGKTLKELGSYNFVPLPTRTNYNTFATQEELNTPTIYISTTSLSTKLIYNLIPKQLKYIDSYEKELKVSNIIYNIKIFTIFIHLILYALLIYLIGVKYNILYSIVISAGIFCFPGISIIAPTAYKGIIMPALFPLYILAFYKYNSNKMKNIIFFIGLGILIFFQWSLNHYMSIFFQLPIILLTMVFCNFYFQMKYVKLENIKSIINIIFEHIRKFSIQYLSITVFSILITLLVLFISYKEVTYLQPQNKENIDYLFFTRSGGEARQASAVLFLADNDSYGNKLKHIEKYYPTYSIDNFLKHTKAMLKSYYLYPIIYPLWNLEQFINDNSLISIAYNILEYISLFHILILILILNIIIIIFFKDKRLYLIIPNLFAIYTFIWFFIFSTFFARVASHIHIYPNILLQYFLCIFLSYTTYLIILILRGTKNNINK